VVHASKDADKSEGFLPHLHSFGLSFNYTGENWGSVTDKTRAAFTWVFKMENVEEVNLESAFRFPVALLVSLARMRYLALSHVDLDADKEIHSTSPCDVALEGLCLRGVSPGVIKPSPKLSQIPPMLRSHYASWR
jgi:hypothetical protein